MPPAIPPELPDRNDVEATWNFLERFIEKFMKDPDQNVSMEMYMNAYIVVHNFCQPVGADGLSIARRQGAPLRGEELYTLLSQYLTNHLQDVYRGSEGHSEEVFLKFYIREWDRYTTAAKFVNHLFRYLNRHWIKREIDEGKRGIYDVYTLHLVRWKEDFFMATHEKVTSGVLNLIEKQRNGQIIEHAHIKSIVEMLVCLSLDDNHSHKALGIYVFYFERPFIAASKAYWKTESQHFMTEHSVVEYIKKVESGLEKDRERVGLYLHPSTMRVYMGTSLEVLVNDHSILLNEFQVLLDGDREEDLACIFRLFSLIHGGLDSLRQTFETHVRKTGLAAVDRVASSGENVDPKTYVDALLGVYFRYHHLANVAFAAKPEFLRSLDNACREFVNANKISKPGSGRSAELLAKYVHTLLRKSTKAPDEFELENKLTEVMTVFNYVEDKDIFKDFYARMLAKRMLHENSLSGDAETSMISKLNIASGFEYTNKLRRMFQDIQTSKPFKAEFKAFQDKMLDVDDKKQPNDLGFAILDTGSWPLGPPRTFFTPPTEILKVTERFQSYYVDMHNGRKLTWLWHLCRGEMCATYIKSSKIPYTFQVSTYQMAILLLFNDEDIIDYEKIFDATSLNKKILDPTLQILLTTNVLLSEPKEATFQKGNKFSLNMNFRSKKIKINLNVALKSEQKQEVEHFQKRIQEDRSLLTQSTIVRIMKSRKKMKYTNIVQETIQQVKTRFPLKIVDIKKNIDILLEKEYLERGEGEELSYLGAGLPQQHNMSNGQERFWEATERKSVISDDFETGQFPSNTVPEYLPLRTVEKQWSIYRPLKEPDEIRLIELLPGEPCNEYKLIHTTLSTCRSSHGYRYTALSYVWGDSNNTTMAIVDGKPLSITVSLNSALQNIRPRPDKQVVYLWADAISINQQDIVERTHQVRQMASIYSCAEKTIIYLFDYAPLAYGLWESRKTSRSASHVKSIVRPILSHPWFTRIWVLQELITSPNPQVQCGHKWESWDSICKILDLKVSDTEDGSHGKRDRTVKDCFQDANLNSDLDVQKWLAVSSWDSAPHNRTASEHLEALQHFTGPIDAQEILESHLANTDTDEELKNAFRGLLLLSEMEDLRSARQNTLGIQERDHYLLKVLQFRRGLEVSDPRDMLFAHTKMVSVPHLDKMVDYASSCKTVYEGFARYLIDEIAGLRLLSFVEDIELEERHGNLIIPGQSNSTEGSSHETIASWAPNWKITTPDHQSQYLRNVVLNSLNLDTNEQLRKMWSHNLSSNRVWLFDGSVLGCIGVLIDFTDDNTEPTQLNNSKHHAHITNDKISSHIQKRDLLLPESYRSHDVLCFLADAPESIHVLRPYSTPEGLPINHAHQYFERKRSESDYSRSHSYLPEKPISVYGLEIRHYKYIGQCFVEGLENSKIHKEMERGQKVIIAIH